jgi:uncharacterized protein (TIGR00369 family)
MSTGSDDHPWLVGEGGEGGAAFEAIRDGWMRAMGARFVRLTAEEVIAELVVGPEHLQPLGVVHGGVYAGLVEAVASIGASVTLAAKAQYAVGLENHTSFLHAVREGRLQAVGRPVHSGRRSRLWEVNVIDERGRTVATGRVRVLVIDQGSSLAGRGANVER